MKSPHAKKQLKWIRYEQLEENELSGYREMVKEEEKEFQKIFAEKLSQIVEE